MSQNNYHPILIQQVFDTPIHQVWSAITEFDELKNWYFDMLHSFEAKEGAYTEFTVQVKDRTFVHQWLITEVFEPKKIAYEWTFDGYEGKGLSSFLLSEKNGQTILDFSFEVLEPFPQNVPEFQRESGLQGWAFFINKQLPKYLNQG